MPLRHAALLLPLLAHAGLVLALYAALTVARKGAVERGIAEWNTYLFGREEPPGVARITRNLSNQFELPVLFYVAILVLLMADEVGPFDHAMAWLFVAGRVIHTWVQTRTDNVPLRGQVFMINVVGVLGLFAHVALVVVRAL